MKYIRITKPVGFLRFEPIYIIDRTRVDCFKRHGDKGRYVNDTLETEENLEKWLKCNKTSILKEANTIEELCDEFVIIFHTEEEGYEKPAIIYNEFPTFVMKNYLLSNPETKSICYGAIWADKGLVYVAKMNEKGELELL